MREARPLQPSELERLPLFPLPRAVFFPGTILPLHFFEPRYRVMMDDCLRNGTELLAVALLQDGWDDDYEGRPPFHAIAGVGRILEHERLPNGTHNVILQGMARVELKEIPLEDKPYREVRATVLRDDGEASHGDVLALMACANAVAQAVRAEHPEFQLDVSPDSDPGRTADQVADRLVANVQTRQEILETTDVAARVRRTTDAVSELLAVLAAQEDAPRPD